MRSALLISLLLSTAAAAQAVPNWGTNGQCLKTVSTGSTLSYSWDVCGGAVGPQGPQGSIGPQGPQGIQGAIGPQGPAGTDNWTRFVTSADHANSTVTPTAVPTLVIPVSASTNYVIRCQLVTSSTIATTGVQLTLTGPASPTALTWTRRSCGSASAMVATYFNTYVVDARTASAGATRCIEEVLVTLRNGVNAGNVGFNLQSEIAASATTVHIGSWCERITF